MAGIVFLRTQDLERTVRFYTTEVGMKAWLEQPGCRILSHGNFLVGFLQAERAETEGILTFYFRERAAVDAMHGKMAGRAEGPPSANPKYRIYNFFARDPENRRIEFQTFDHPVPQLPGGDDLLETRRSIRVFDDTDLSEALLQRVFSSCRYSPTSRHSESYYYVIVRKRDVLEKLAAMRGNSSAPIARAPLAVAVCSDPAKSGGHRADGDIAATYLMLSAWTHGLGTCWIGSMDRDDAKDLLGIPRRHFIATVTPLGRPAESPEPRPRRTVAEFVRTAGGE